MNCQKCNSQRILSLSAKCSDLCFATLGTEEKDGYVPCDLGIGGGDYVEIQLCLDCGQLQGKFPIKKNTLKEEDEDE